MLRSIRRRLTLLYSALLMVAGALLLGFTYLLVSYLLVSRSKPSTAVGSYEGYEGYEGSGVPGAVGGPGVPGPDPPSLTTYAEVPLTLQQAIVDVALADPDASVDTLRAACLRVRAAGREQERLIDALLTLARSQGGLQRSRSSWSAWWPTSSTTPYVTTIRTERGVGTGCGPDWTAGSCGSPTAVG
ncbi:hypothetical protein ACFWA5_21830 [Streptomyces mirabilis]|uniref:hypothetical protein n=1 Tax=Streptomyces mirabilis TaxID=68239 RepID=UPI00365D3884